jgi:hypothetical protein
MGDCHHKAPKADTVPRARQRDTQFRRLPVHRPGISQGCCAALQAVRSAESSAEGVGDLGHPVQPDQSC